MDPRAQDGAEHLSKFAANLCQQAGEHLPLGRSNWKLPVGGLCAVLGLPHLHFISKLVFSDIPVFSVFWEYGAFGIGLLGAHGI